MESSRSMLHREPVRRLLQPFVRFAQLESSGSVLLLFATSLALCLANSRFASLYESFLAMPLKVGIGAKVVVWPIEAWVNDLLMAVFFLVVGLEVKRELLVGELASFSRAILPVLAAAGGMIVPAGIYLALNHSAGTARGWGVPIATDIAFSLAVLRAFGKRVPLALSVFLASLAIADDIGGVIVIAVAYTRHLHLAWMAAGLGVFLFCLLLNWLGVVRISVYLTAGGLLWVCLHDSGIHPTLAGILLALAIPSRSFLSTDNFVEHGHARLRHYTEANTTSTSHQEARAALGDLRHGIQLVESPLDRLQASLHPWVSYVIVPMFALVNAGISFRSLHSTSITEPIFAGVALGLLLGKPIGITFFSWLAVRSGIAALPHGVSWAQLHAASWIAGIGFTVSIFIAGLAFGSGPRYTEIRVAIMLASSCAAAAGALLLRNASNSNGSAILRPESNQR